MAVGDPLKSVGVGLGKKPNPGANACNGTGGTAVMYHDPSDYGSLMALRGQIVPAWYVDYPPGPETQPAAFYARSPRDHRGAGTTSVKFLRVRIVNVRCVFGAVEVTLQYGAVQPVLPGRGWPIPPTDGPQEANTQINNSRSNIKTN